MRVTNLAPDELEDFENSLRRRKRSNNEFKLVEDAQHTIGTGIQPQRGTITVRHIKSGTERVYSTGSGNMWTVDFENDLDAHVF